MKRCDFRGMGYAVSVLETTLRNPVIKFQRQEAFTPKEELKLLFWLVARGCRYQPRYQWNAKST